MQLLLVVGAQMNDRKLTALIGMLRSKCRIVSSPKDVSRGMQVCNTINTVCALIFAGFNVRGFADQQSSANISSANI